MKPGTGPGILVTVASMLCGCALAFAQDAIKAPAQKTIGMAMTEIVPSLIVLNSDGASLSGNILTLIGISTNAIMFADHPPRSAGHALTVHLLEEWTPGSGSFAGNPPNATVSVLNKDASAVEDAVVVLKEPKLSGSTLTFNVEVLAGSLSKANGPAAIFIDITGLPFTPLSLAGVARSTASRAAWYASAAAAAAYYHRDYRPYDHPYYPPQNCGYYPYPPCD
jgi:hypothetical protein